MHCLPVTEFSQVAEARRFTTQLACGLGFTETDSARVALVVTEAATNLVEHATGGQLLVQSLPDVGGLELLALDTGPGIRYVAQSLRDGYSTAGSLGTGLGAITRLATFWDIYSILGVGTALLMGMMPSSPPLLTPVNLDVGVVCIPKAGESVCGDASTVIQQPGCSLILLHRHGVGPSRGSSTGGPVRYPDLARRHQSDAEEALSPPRCSGDRKASGPAYGHTGAAASTKSARGSAVPESGTLIHARGAAPEAGGAAATQPRAGGHQPWSGGAVRRTR